MKRSLPARVRERLGFSRSSSLLERVHRFGLAIGLVVLERLLQDLEVARPAVRLHVAIDRSRNLVAPERFDHLLAQRRAAVFLLRRGRRGCRRPRGRTLGTATGRCRRATGRRRACSDARRAARAGAAHRRRLAAAMRAAHQIMRIDARRARPQLLGQLAHLALFEERVERGAVLLGGARVHPARPRVATLVARRTRLAALGVQLAPRLLGPVPAIPLTHVPRKRIALS